MLYIYDVDGYKGDFGSRLTVNEYEAIAGALKLNTIINFFKEGFTFINIFSLNHFSSTSSLGS